MLENNDIRKHPKYESLVMCENAEDKKKLIEEIAEETGEEKERIFYLSERDAYGQ